MYVVLEYHPASNICPLLAPVKSKLRPLSTPSLEEHLRLMIGQTPLLYFLFGQVRSGSQVSNRSGTEYTILIKCRSSQQRKHYCVHFGTVALKCNPE